MHADIPLLGFTRFNMAQIAMVMLLSIRRKMALLGVLWRRLILLALNEIDEGDLDTSTSSW